MYVGGVISCTRGDGMLVKNLLFTHSITMVSLSELFQCIALLQLKEIYRPTFTDGALPQSAVSCGSVLHMSF